METYTSRMSPSLRRGFLFALLLWSTASGRQRPESRVAVSTDSCQRRPDDCGQSGQPFPVFPQRQEMAGKIACDGKGRVENGNQEKHELTPLHSMPDTIARCHGSLRLLWLGPKRPSSPRPSQRRQRRKWCGCESKESGHSWSQSAAWAKWALGSVADVLVLARRSCG